MLFSSNLPPAWYIDRIHRNLDLQYWYRHWYCHIALDFDNCYWYCHWYLQDKHIGIAIAIDTDMEKTLPLLLPLILIWKKHCHCYWHWYCDMEKIAIDIAIDIVTGKILLLILSLVLLIPQPLLLLLPLDIWRPDNCYGYCSKNFAIAHVCMVLVRQFKILLGACSEGI